MSSYAGVTNLNTIDFKDTDLFIGNLSFETRCLSAIRNIDINSINKILFFENKIFSKFYEENKLILRDYTGVKLNLVDCDSKNTIGMTDILFDSIKNNLPPNSKVVIDITTFTRETLLILLKILDFLKSHLGSITWIYNSASTINTSWLSRGVLNIKTVFGYSGNMVPSKPLHLVILAGFEVDRAREIIDAYEPELISIGCGDANNSMSNALYIENKNLVDKLVSYYGTGNVKQFNFGLSNPNSTKNELLRYLEEYPDYNTIIAPLNNKISTLGAGILAIDRNYIQLCYAEVAEYNVADYSEPSQTFFIYEGFDFDPILESQLI